MKIKTIWIVTKPTPNSELGDICFETSAEKLQRQFLGGLNASEIRGMYTDKKTAVQEARKLLQGMAQ